MINKLLINIFKKIRRNFKYNFMFSESDIVVTITTQTSCIGGVTGWRVTNIKSKSARVKRQLHVKPTPTIAVNTVSRCGDGEMGHW